MRMSSHFSANQYNESYWPRRLGNWQYGVNHPGTYPKTRRGPTCPITDENGRFLSGIPRNSSSSPWGDYEGWIWEESMNRCACVDRLRNPQHYSMPKSTILVARERPHPVQEANMTTAALTPQLFQSRPPPGVTTEVIHLQANMPAQLENLPINRHVKF